MTKSSDSFVEQHTKLVHSIAHKLQRRLDLDVEHEELVQLGFHGLLEAKERFDPSRGVQFSTFAYYRVRGAMIDGVRKMAFLPRRIHEKVRAAEAVSDITESAHEAYMAGERGVDQALGAIDETMNRIAASYVMSAVGQSEVDEGPSAEEALITRESIVALKGLLGTLPDRERALIEGHYLQGRQFDEVAKELGISKSWASRLHQKALDRLRLALEAAA